VTCSNFRIPDYYSLQLATRWYLIIFLSNIDIENVLQSFVFVILFAGEIFNQRVSVIHSKFGNGLISLLAQSFEPVVVAAPAL